MFRSLFPLAFIAAPAFGEVGACPITADFIEEPETLASTQQMGSASVTSTTMRAFVDGAMVQIECTEVSPGEVFPGQDDATILTNYARFWSIELSGPAYREGDRYVVVGTRDIQGLLVTYSYRLFKFEDSFAMIATAVPGGGPSADVERFLASIEVASDGTLSYSETEIAEARRNHIAACLPAVRADNEARQLGISEVEITYYCSCTGQKYFTEFTRSELRALALGSDTDLEKRRSDIQVECFEDAIR